MKHFEDVKKELIFFVQEEDVRLQGWEKCLTAFYQQNNR